MKRNCFECLNVHVIIHLEEHPHTHHTKTHIYTHTFTPMYTPENLVHGCAVPKKGKGSSSRSRFVGRAAQQRISIHSMQYVCLAQVCAISTAIYSKFLVPAL